MSRSLLQKLKPYYVRKAFRYLKHYGPKDFLIRVRERMAPDEVPYGPWYEAHKPAPCCLDGRVRIRRNPPVFSKLQDADSLIPGCRRL